jgi:hypothetical protein
VAAADADKVLQTLNAKGGKNMRKSLSLGILLALFCSTAFALTAVEGKVNKIDRTAKTIVVKTADGTEHTILVQINGLRS